MGVEVWEVCRSILGMGLGFYLNTMLKHGAILNIIKIDLIRPATLRGESRILSMMNYFPSIRNTIPYTTAFPDEILEGE